MRGEHRVLDFHGDPSIHVALTRALMFGEAW
jgi:hypothetical protein